LNSTELHKKVPSDRPIWVSFYCCQQFIISRDMIRRRSLETWKNLSLILSQQSACHQGEPEYDFLHAYNKNKIKRGPEPSLLPDFEFSREPGTGRFTQAVTSEHLSHVIFGHYNLDMDWPDEDLICKNFLPNCPGSPCTRRY